ncbi:uncharacterized protein LOC114274865 [Camellia sinensis]|uniref:uncharacterized protein LOC114274865 n=1 Tax=Camellia sinensis TaxID=4442 RepID=UPI001035FE29|nr:uncharacterized protein LOC114274865 [Camellia sinensis]
MPKATLPSPLNLVAANYVLYSNRSHLMLSRSSLVSLTNNTFGRSWEIDKFCWNMDLFLLILIWDDERFVEFHRFQHMMCPILECKTRNTINLCLWEAKVGAEDHMSDTTVFTV